MTVPTTANRAYRYPLNTDPPNVPLDLQRLAEDVDADVQANVTGLRVVRLRRAATQSTANNTNTAISWDTEDEDGAGLIAVTSATLTVPAGAAGLWSVAGLVRWNAFTAGEGAAWITVNGGTVLDGPGMLNKGASYGVQAPVDGYVRLAVADTVQMLVKQNSGGSVNCTARLHMHWLAA